MSALTFSSSLLPARKSEHGGLLWFGAACVLAGAAVSTLLWRRRLRAVQAVASPLERAEELIANCERKLDTIEKSVADIKEIQSDLQAGQSSVSLSAEADSGPNSTAHSRKK